MAAAYELEGAFNHLILDLRPEAEPKAVIEAVDQALRPYGGTGAYGRMDYPSHSFLEAEFQGLAAMAGTLPPIFLGVATFLLNVLLGRTIELDRESIGLLKALGYRRMEVAGHYLKLVGILVVAGILLGFALGGFVGHGFTDLYADYYHFPYLVFRFEPAVFAVAALGAVCAVGRAAAIAPAVAMRPRRRGSSAAGLWSVSRDSLSGP